VFWVSPGYLEKQDPAVNVWEKSPDAVYDFGPRHLPKRVSKVRAERLAHVTGRIVIPLEPVADTVLPLAPCRRVIRQRPFGLETRIRKLPGAPPAANW